MQRLDYTRTGRWRLIAALSAGAADLFAEEAEAAADLPAGAGIEVEEIAPEKWLEIAPLFPR